MSAVAAIESDALADHARRAGLVVHASAGWPESTQDTEPPALAGFVLSSFSPLVAEVAERCLRRAYGQPPADPARGSRTALVLLSALGDVASAVRVAHAVDTGARVAPLLFFQSVPNAVAGYVSARWGLTGPVACLSATGDGLDAAALLIEDGDADEALVILVAQALTGGERDHAAGVLVARSSTLDIEGERR
ncbi:MAG TPA: beta-ketoacyl synthase chain length factor [Micromonosporaceae bacterium]|jgi:3-oxoacyl-(acyl-carrier-protein) synthase|nr:beta-ketoacyl synthase chain length factor [Micromonosporaceae bacterium]